MIPWCSLILELIRVKFLIKSVCIQVSPLDTGLPLASSADLEKQKKFQILNFAISIMINEFVSESQCRTFSNGEHLDLNFAKAHKNAICDFLYSCKNRFRILCFQVWVDEKPKFVFSGTTWQVVNFKKFKKSFTEVHICIKIKY